jgi:hypothetical protein
MSGYVVLQMDAYATFSRSITIKSSDGSPQNLAYYTANAQMRKSHYSSSSNTITAMITDASNGVITLSMSPAETGNLDPGRYVYDVVTTSNTGLAQRMLEGIIVVSPGVTRP